MEVAEGSSAHSGYPEESHQLLPDRAVRHAAGPGDAGVSQEGKRDEHRGQRGDEPEEAAHIHHGLAYSR